MRYDGRILSIATGQRFGFIGLASVKKKEGGLMHGLQTSSDIYIHQDDCSSPLSQGMEVTFEVVPDQRRGENTLRATNARQLVHALVLADDNSENEWSEDYEMADPRALYVPPTPAQRMLMKPVAEEAVEKVVLNRPMPNVPRNYTAAISDPEALTRGLMKRIFPQFAAISQDGADIASEHFDTVIKQAVDDHKNLGMEAQAQKLIKQAATYKGLRTFLKSEEDLLKPETLIPIQYLPDLFMAVPVWYFWADANTKSQVTALNQLDDPRVHPHLAHFCERIPNPRWCDTFLMYNRRMRTLTDYQGDLIPPRIIARMRKLAGLLDYLVIMTPYHDVAGKDWENIQWLRSIDPYVVGFIKDVPLMFVLGRFSDSGTFPLYSELVADTIAFLRTNMSKLTGFNRVRNPYWYRPDKPTESIEGLGTHLIRHTRELLAAFDAGSLFDWLRNQDRPAQKA